MVALGRGSTSVDALPLAGAPRAVAALPAPLAALGDLPGARSVLVVAADGERVRGELGGPSGDALAVLSWARRLADVSRDRGRALEDVVLTTESAWLLVRCVPGVGGDVWVVLRIDREHGNLALARRALAALPSADRSAPGRPRALAPEPRSGSFPAAVSRPLPATGSFPAAMPAAGGTAPLAPAPRRASDPTPSRPAHRAGTDVPALALLPPSRPAPRPGPTAPPEEPRPPAATIVPAPRVEGASRASDDRDAPARPAETDPDPVPPAAGDRRRRTLTVRQARTWRTAAETPEAHEQAEPAAPATSEPTPPAAAILVPRAGSLFAPVVVVPPPPSPVDDDTTEVPAPVPYPVITAPPLEPAPEPVAALAAPEVEPAVTDAGLPRRVPGALLRPTTPAPEPAPAVTPAVALPGWATEPSVLRRLLLGLRRLT